ncbi:MAG: LIC_10190 family membrane protein [Flavobacterium sp.]
MLLLLFYFIYLWTVFFAVGTAFKRCLWGTAVSVINILIGGIAVSLFFFSTVAFLMPLDGTAMALYNFFVILIFWANRKFISDKHKAIISTLRKEPISRKISYAALMVMVLAVSAMPPFLIDNETYYIQSIQWLNQLGYTKGLANLHPFLGQMSAWHVLEAGLNVHWIEKTTNDLNGFLFLIVVGSALKSTFNQERVNALLLMMSPLLLFFVSSPSPDLPILLGSAYLAVKMLNENQDYYRDQSVGMALVLAMLFLMKITILPLLGLLFLLSYNNKNRYKMGAIAAIAGLVWMVKNYIISGWMLYPFPFWQANEMWTLPNEFYRFEVAVQQVGFLQRIGPSFWILLTGVFASVWVFLTSKSRVKNILILLATMQVGMVVASNASVRLALPGIMIWVLVIGSLFSFEKHKSKLKFVPMLVCIVGLCVFGLLNFKSFKVNKTGMHHGGKTFSYQQVVIPANNTRFEFMRFEKCEEGNLEYYSPKQKMLLFNTFAGPLPTLNRNQLKYFKKRFHLVPQKIGNDLSDGFYSKKLME